ncbi:MAG: DnaB-like helicase C-terminal domain-containing protein [Acutalibacteraceae bacterium]|nr:DnaB-like helicase C-terminal domain-containing protein [Acutalibacteraceae bacterium]
MLETTHLENEIIGAFLSVEESRKNIALTVKADYFSNNTVKEIYKHLFKEYKKYPKADIQALVTGLTLEQKRYCIAITQDPNLNFKINSDTLKKFTAQARTRLMNEEVTQLTQQGVLTAIQLKQILEKYNSPENQNSKNAFEQYIENFDKEIKYISTGFTHLDNKLNGGFVEGSLVAIGARPSVGKTTFAVNIARANNNKKVLVFSLEMGAGQLIDRLLSDILTINYSKMQKHIKGITDEQSNRMVNAIDSCRNNLTIIDNISTVEEIVNKINSCKPDLVIIDYIQIVATQTSYTDPRHRIDYISRELKACAKETGAVIVNLSQVTRAGKDRPTMSDLKESGGLEQDSDYIMLLHRPYVQDKSNKEHEPEDTTIYLDKHKFGATGVLEFKFITNFQRFIEIGQSDINTIARPVNSNEDLDFLGEQAS